MTASTERASPLSEWESAFRQASGAAADFRIREVPFGAQIDVRGDTTDSRFQAAIRSATGCELPGSPNTWTTGRDGMMLWLGPDEWLLLAEEGRNEALAAALRAALGSLGHSVTDVSARRAAVEDPLLLVPDDDQHLAQAGLRRQASELPFAEHRSSRVAG